MFNISMGFPAPAPWYESGYWPLAGAIVTVIIANLAIFYQQWASHQSSLKLKKVEFIRSQLEEFYNPVLALLSENKEVFDNFGPQTFGRKGASPDIAAKYWAEMRDQFVRPNNKVISRIITDKSHLISRGDDLGTYMKLKVHIDAYSVFENVNSEIYGRFRFPVGIQENVIQHREKLISQLEKLRGI